MDNKLVAVTASFRVSKFGDLEGIGLLKKRVKTLIDRDDITKPSIETIDFDYLYDLESSNIIFIIILKIKNDLIAKHIVKQISEEVKSILTRELIQFFESSDIIYMEN